MDINSFRAKLDQLDALLRVEGMPCGPDVWHLVYRLLERFEKEQRLPNEARQLAPLLGPLFCRHPEDQARFPILFEQWLANDNNSTLASTNRVIAPEQTVIKAVRNKAKKTGWYWLLGILVLLAALVAGLMYQPVEQPPLQKPAPNPTTHVTPPIQTPKNQAKITIVNRISPRSQAEPPSQDLANLLHWIALSLNWLPGCLALLWLTKRYHQHWILNRQAANGDDLLNNFRFERVLTPIFGGAKAEQALRDLRAASFHATRRLDVIATAEATARSGDYFQPIYRNRRTTPEHLLLIRSQHRNDLQAALAEELVARFKQLGLQVQAYQFKDDPRWLVRWDDKYGEYLELSQLVARHNQARLLVISETAILFHPYSGEVRSWLQDFSPWQDRVWLHPRDADTEHAALLTLSNFLLLPLERDSLPELVARLTATETKTLKPPLAYPLPLPDIITAEPDAWLGEKPPYGTDLTELVRQLERYLGTYGLRLLRAVAVYPKPRWQLAQALDYLLFGQLNSVDPPERREQRLARLSRLPWLTHVHLPDWLRETLLLDMDKTERQYIITAWQKLFAQLTNEEADNTLSLDIRTPSKRQLKLSLADFRAMKNSEAVNDAIFANILLGGKLGLLDFKLPRAMAKLLPNTGKWLNLRPALAALFLASLSIWGFNVAWQTYGKQALTKFVSNRTTQENARWHIAIDYLPDTQALANQLNTNLQTAKFNTTLQPGKNVYKFTYNAVYYAANGEVIAKRVAQSLRWFTYGVDIKLIESALSPNNIQVKLSQTYQHTASFNDTLQNAYQKLEPITAKQSTDPKSTPEAAKSNTTPLEPDMALIKPGKFLMGSPEKESGRWSAEDPQHEVAIAYSFEIGKTEVTFNEYDRFASATGRKLLDDNGWGRGKQPVINVNFNDAQAYVRWLSQQTGKNYRLPTEAEWEYAARAGTNTAYWWGDSIGKNHAVCSNCGSQWDNKQTAPAGSFKANKFGLYDTAGNVYEWTQDCWHGNYQNAPLDGSAWLESDNGECDRRVVRGGSWDFNPLYLRSADRDWDNTDEASYNLGFRIARAL